MGEKRRLIVPYLLFALAEAGKVKKSGGQREVANGERGSASL